MSKNELHPVAKLAKPGRSIMFKRSEGRGRPALGKVVRVSTKGITVESANGRLERVNPHLIKDVQTKGPVEKIDPLTAAKAESFDRDLASA